jgi:histidinol dehydrogenase
LYAPEHLILQSERADSLLEGVTNAGSIFLGAWTPESAGDYASGTNHVLPTYGAARFTSSLGLADFQKRSTVQKLSRDGLNALGQTIMTLAKVEGLHAHAQAVAIRLKEESS